MSVVYPASSPPGPAGRWLIERLKLCPGSPNVLPVLDPARACSEC
jgi:hypothetical protein